MDPNQQPQNQQPPGKPQEPQSSQPPLTPQEQMQAAQQNQWQYTSGQLTEDNAPTTPVAKSDNSSEDILAEWSASEFVEHNKNINWYAFLIVVTVVLSAILFLITGELMSVIVTVLLAILLAVYGAAKPKTINYAILSQGISLDGKKYAFTEFKSFSIIDDGAIPYIQLMPQKRLMVPITIYVDPAHSKDVTEIIGQYLPYDQKKRDFVDKLSSKLRF